MSLSTQSPKWIPHHFMVVSSLLKMSLYSDDVLSSLFCSSNVNIENPWPFCLLLFSKSKSGFLSPLYQNTRPSQVMFGLVSSALKIQPRRTVWPFCHFLLWIKIMALSFLSKIVKDGGPCLGCSLFFSKRSFSRPSRHCLLRSSQNQISLVSVQK
jgi:hypothetical protein